MRLKKLIASCLAISMMGLSLTACGNNNGNDKATNAEATQEATTGEAEKVSLTVWGPQEDQAPNGDYSEGILKAMCEKFNEQHPEWDITFEYGVCSEGALKLTKLRTLCEKLSCQKPPKIKKRITKANVTELAKLYSQRLADRIGSFLYKSLRRRTKSLSGTFLSYR